MDILSGVSMPQLMTIASTIGLPGLVVLIWATDVRSFNRLVSEWKAETHRMTTEWRRETTEILGQYRSDIQTLKEMYVTNVALVKDYKALADQSHETNTLVVQSLARMTEKIENNLYCPIIREREHKR